MAKGVRTCDTTNTRQPQANAERRPPPAVDNAVAANAQTAKRIRITISPNSD